MDSDIFEEWTSYASKKALKQRSVDFAFIERNAGLKIIAVTGIRRSGKSSALMLLAQTLLSKGNEKVGYVNVEDNRLSGNPLVLDDVLKWFGDRGFLLLDEITSASDWSGWLARVHELMKGDLKLVVSSSRKSLEIPQKPLRGRVLDVEFYPLSFKEFLEFTGVAIEKTTVGRGRLEKAFYAYLKYGGFPEVSLVKEDIDKIEVLNSYFRDIIGLDVAEVCGEDVAAVDLFAKYVLSSPTFSASKCLNFFKTIGFKIGKEKILELEYYSQASYLFFFLPVFSYSIKDASQYARKSYCGDTGFFYAITGKTNLGRLFENTAFLELKKRVRASNEICYWKNKEGFEVDFLVKEGTSVTQIIQVVYDLADEKTRIRETRAAVACAKELGVKTALILTKDVTKTQSIDGIKLSFKPLMDWLLEDSEKL